MSAPHLPVLKVQEVVSGTFPEVNDLTGERRPGTVGIELTGFMCVDGKDLTEPSVVRLSVPIGGASLLIHSICDALAAIAVGSAMRPLRPEDELP